MNKVRITVKPETRLERHVKAWINRTAQNYESGAKGVLKDLFHGGCASGIVGELIPTVNCVKFFQRYRRDISALLAELIDSTGEGIETLFRNDVWDKTDPLAHESSNRNLLAWFGFEEAARMLADRQEIEV